MNGLVVELAWKSTIVLAAAFAATRALGRAPAAVRHFVWTAAFSALLLLPLASAIGPRWNVSPAIPTAAAPSAQPAHAETLVIHAAGRSAAPRLPLEFLYSAGVLLMIGRFAAGFGRALRMVRRAAIAPHAV